MKNLTFIFAIIFATSSFAQFDQGTWSFGAGQMFISTASFEGMQADASYFVMDGLMVSVSLSGSTEVGDIDLEDSFYYDEATMDWGLGVRYYINDDGLFAGLNFDKVDLFDVNDDGEYNYDADGIPEEKTALDMTLSVGFSKQLMENIWFEPMFSVYIPAGGVDPDFGGMITRDAPMTYGIGGMFRFAF